MNASLWLLVLLAVLPGAQALAADAPQESNPGDGARVDIDALKRKYWEKGEALDVRVVQNRLYKKALRFEAGMFGGNMSTDPFLSVKEAGGTFGFHLNEYFAVGVVGWRSFVKPSSALEALERDTKATAQTNPPRSFLGIEMAVSPIYGKLSLFGLAIIHYDLHFLGGLGRMQTDLGQPISPILGIGQQFYLGRHAALRLDYRALWYSEQFPGTASPRTASCDVITLGASFLFGFFD